MYRRRRSNRDKISFGFDCFLDVVANVIGIIVRLILVAWVGARSYTATMQWVEETPSSSDPAPAAQISDDPLSAELARARRELDEARARLLAQLGQLDESRKKADDVKTQLADLTGKRLALETEASQAGSKSAKRDGAVKQAALSLDEMRQRTRKLQDEIKALEAQPAKTKQFHYHAPVSRAVYDDQVRFECHNGRVTYIDLTGLVSEMKADLDSHVRELRSQWTVAHTTGPVGLFRLHYTLYRSKSGMDALGNNAAPAPNAGFSLSYRFVLEPITEQRGETLEQALTPGSEFRQLVDRLDSRLTVVTFHVYPDSFAVFRQLRDYLYDRDIEVAGAPQPEGQPIAFSPHGVMSRGQ
jgi:hypothetical protein